MWIERLARIKIAEIPVAALLGSLLGLIILPLILPTSYWIRIAGNAGLWIMLSLGLNVVAGFAGLLDLGYIAFYGIGGYIYALLCSTHWGLHLPFWLALPICAVVASGFGWALGATSLRVRGDYLAIVTLAFAQIFRLLLLNLDRPINFTGGPNGIIDIDYAKVFGYTFSTVTQYYYLIMFFVLFVVLGSHRLKQSRLGRGWEAIREDELAANAMGVNTTFMKLLAFGIGAGIAGGVGAIFASWQGGVFPGNFDFPQLVTAYCMLILGGVGNIWGVILAAVILSILPEALRSYGEYRMIGYGLLLVLLMAFRPQGILGSINFLTREKVRPDKDETGYLKASTDLYYATDHAVDAGSEYAVQYTKGDRVILELQEVTQNFGGIMAVNSLDLTLHEQEILSIIGPNGAGKTTVFNLISGIYPPSSGAILFEGSDITNLKPHQVVKKGIARTFQTLRLFNAMTVLDNAKVGRFCRTNAGFFSIVLRLPRSQNEETHTQEHIERVLALFGGRLTGYRFEQQAMFLSYANRRRLEIARAICTDAKILLLDEPSAGMNPQETVEITDFIKKLRDRHGYTILVIEHKLNLVKSISDRVIALDYGRKIADGRYQEVADNPQVIEAYLGRKRR